MRRPGKCRQSAATAHGAVGGVGTGAETCGDMYVTASVTSEAALREYVDVWDVSSAGVCRFQLPPHFPLTFTV